MQKPSDLYGIAAMLAATAIFVVGDTFMKLLTEDLPPFQVLFLRGLAATIACGVVLAARREWTGWTDALSIRVLLRAAGETLGTLCYIIALAQMPIADVIAILQIAPLILMLGVALLLGEKIGPLRVVLALIGFAGALMVAQPNAAGVSPATLLVFGSALMIAGRDLIARGIPNRIPATVVIFTTVVMSMLVAGIITFSAETWKAPTTGNLLHAGLTGLCLALGQVGLILAYRLGRTAVVAPFFYSFALWGVVAGVLIWGQLPNALALAGIALVIASGIAIVMLDQRKGREVELTDAL
jgi:drug/metabolite transporter (DMT)-like permease